MSKKCSNAFPAHLNCVKYCHSTIALPPPFLFTKQQSTGSNCKHRKHIVAAILFVNCPFQMALLHRHRSVLKCGDSLCTMCSAYAYSTARCALKLSCGALERQRSLCLTNWDLFEVNEIVAAAWAASPLAVIENWSHVVSPDVMLVLVPPSRHHMSTWHRQTEIFWEMPIFSVDHFWGSVHICKISYDLASTRHVITCWRQCSTYTGKSIPGAL